MGIYNEKTRHRAWHHSSDHIHRRSQRRGLGDQSPLFQGTDLKKLLNYGISDVIFLA